jgi:hypothetical protein
VIEQRVLVVWSPAWSSICVDFDLDHLLDAVDDARHADLLLRFGMVMVVLVAVVA